MARLCKVEENHQVFVGQAETGTEDGVPGEIDRVTVKSDANWVGCKETRKSTSGGCVFLGRHLIKLWSKTQHCVATSSAESEGIALVKATSEGLGIARVLSEWEDRDVGVIIWADASAALGMIERGGTGKVRHIDFGIRWLQQK